jgi:hypothetical protein
LPGTAGGTATLRTQADIMSHSNSMTVTGPTAIADGVRYTVLSTGGASQVNNMTLIASGTVAGIVVNTSVA